MNVLESLIIHLTRSDVMLTLTEFTEPEQVRYHFEPLEAVIVNTPFLKGS